MKPLLTAALGIALCFGQTQTKEQRPYLAPDPGAFPLGDTQGTGRIQPAPVKVVPAPKLADGRPDFGGDGVWYPGFNGNVAETKWKGAKSVDVQVDVR